MVRDENPTRGEIIAPVPLVVRGVSEEDTESRTGCQLVGSSGCGVRVARTPEDAKVVVLRRGAEQSMVRRGSWAGNGRKAVKEVGGGVEALGPEARRERRLKEGAHGLGGGANHALSLAVLRGGVRARHAQLDTVREKESTGGRVVELSTIVALDGLDGEAELCGHPSEEVEDRGKSISLGT